MNETSNERDEISNDHSNNRTFMVLCCEDEMNRTVSEGLIMNSWIECLSLTIYQMALSYSLDN